jgi:ketosteroid isomerase-like protein
MFATNPEDAVELLDKAFNEGDLATVLSFYEDKAVVITEPGKSARGKEELKHFFEGIMQAGSSAKQVKTHVIEADGIALFLSRWTLEVKDASVPLRTFTATTVFRRQQDGGWKVLIDNPLGPLVLGLE